MTDAIAASPYLSRLKTELEASFVIRPGEKILVAISAGADSVWLAYGLHSLGYSIGLAHVNFHLRGKESAAEEKLIHQLGNSWKVPVWIHQAAAPSARKKASLQSWARKVRYAFFAQLLDTEAFPYCATAHHADDRIETLLMSLLKGNSPRIWQDIPRQREVYIRPLYHWSREEIRAALSHHKLPFLEDSSNANLDYLRNRIRHQLLPLISEMNPSVKEQLLRRNAWYLIQMTALEEWLEPWEAQTNQATLFGHDLRLDLLPASASEAQRMNLIMYVLEKWGLHGYSLWQGAALLNSQVGKQIQAPEGQLIRSRTGLSYYLDAKKSAPFQSRNWTQFDEPQLIAWSGNRLTMMKIGPEEVAFQRTGFHYLDWDTLQWPIRLRVPQSGDLMIPLGMQQHKKISDIFVDETYSLWAKQHSWVIEDQAGIVWLSGFRIAERVKVTSDTQAVLGVEFFSSV